MAKISPSLKLFLAVMLGLIPFNSAFAKYDRFTPFKKKDEQTKQYSPWFTGPLLAPSSSVIPPGHANIEPYFYYTTITGLYSPRWKPYSTANFYNKTVSVPIQVGLVDRLDFQCIPQYNFNSIKGASYNGFGDMPLILDVQLLAEKESIYDTIIKLSFSANAPIGKYQKLSAKNLYTDAIGSGSLQPTALIVASKLFHIAQGPYFLDTRLSLGYSVGTKVHVKGINTYGGDPTTKGVAYPGNTFITDFAIELSLSQNWVFANDLVYSHSNKSRFSGKTVLPSKRPSKEQLSFAPAMEYNFSQNIGVIGGVWFSALGRNSSRFISGVVAINIYI